MKVIKHIFWLTVAIIALATWCSLFTSCNITKAKKTQSVDSTRTIKTDSGSVIKTTANEKTLADWTRQTLVFNNSKDTTINHYYTTTINGKTEAIDYSRLAAVINEKGNYQQEKNIYIVDSSWKKSLDSLKLVIKESVKNKTETPSPLLIKIAAAIVLFLVAAAAVKIMIKK
jgi:hypothetical protein